MASRFWPRASIRLRTTVAAVCVVTTALILAALALVWILRDSMSENLETTAEQQIAALESNLPLSSAPTDPEHDGDLEDLIWQILNESGEPVATSTEPTFTLPTQDTDRFRIPGTDHSWLVSIEEVEDGGTAYTIAVAVSREPIAEAVSAVTMSMVIGIPLLAMVVAGTTWMVVSRALRPVMEIQREVSLITEQQLNRRVPQPIARDEISQLATTMNQMLERLDHSQRKQRQFVADASHELRSPLASIRQYAEVSRAHPDVVPAGELAEAVYEESTRMQELVKQLLLLARLDDQGAGLKSIEIDLDDIALDAAARVRAGGARVDTSGVHSARVLGDPVALRQVVDNLVDNACRFAESQVTISVSSTGGTATLTVADDGPGIPVADRKEVFERFVRLDDSRARSSGGTGLGLAIVKEIVVQHQGSVMVTDSDIGGAQFVVQLPC